MNDYATRVLESLAKATWERIRFGEDLGCSQGEETITDVNLLDLKRAGPHAVKIVKVKRAAEARYGLDWEWWVGTDHDAYFGGWWRYAVQAKKLDRSGRYSVLRHKVGDRYQFDILKAYALKNRCIPLYCFYNFVVGDTKDYWHCCELPYSAPQLGCTVAPLEAVAPVFHKGASKRFEDIHQDERVLPWRCLVGCLQLAPLPGRTNHPLAGSESSNLATYEELPLFLREGIDDGTVARLPPELYSSDAQIYPKRIIIIDVSSVGTLG